MAKIAILSLRSKNVCKTIVATAHFMDLREIVPIKLSERS